MSERERVARGTVSGYVALRGAQSCTYLQSNSAEHKVREEQHPSPSLWSLLIPHLAVYSNALRVSTGVPNSRQRMRPVSLKCLCVGVKVRGRAEVRVSSWVEAVRRLGWASRGQQDGLDARWQQ